MNTLTRAHVTAIAVAAAAASAPLLVIIGVPQPGQALLGLVLLGFLPGFALLRLGSGREPVQTIALSIALSLALATVLASSLLYLGMWSWQACVVLLGGIALVASGLELRRRPA